MTFNDIFKKSFINGYANQIIGTTDILITLAITCLLALYIFFVYRVITRRTFYSKSFNISLAAMSVITAAVILTIQSSVVISLGMVGALSIVRFRTAIKDPMDLVFLFWAMSVGIICGAGLAEIAVFTSLVITAGIFILDRLPIAKMPMMLVVNASDYDRERGILDIVEKYSQYYKVKSRNITERHLDMVVEIRVRDESSFIKEIAELDGLTTVSLLSHDGEVTF